MAISFRHAVGKSTLKEGFAVPKAAEEWIGAPTAGQKKIIRLVFDGHECVATLRRLRNERGHVQVKYETHEGAAFRNWLTSTFASRPDAATGDYFEVVLGGPDCLEIRPSVAEAQLFPHLAVQEWKFHHGAKQLFEQEPAMSEIPAVVRAVSFDGDRGQSHYNSAISDSFKDWNWDCEGMVIPELGLKYDFAKEGVQVEVEFGNARTYYQDYIKFLLGHRHGSAHIGVLLVPTSSFAKHLCDIGKQRAREKGRRCYSGMMDFSKASREFSYLQFLLSMPLAIGGIGLG